MPFVSIDLSFALISLSRTSEQPATATGPKKEKYRSRVPVSSNRMWLESKNQNDWFDGRSRKKPEVAGRLNIE